MKRAVFAMVAVLAMGCGSSSSEASTSDPFDARAGTPDAASAETGADRQSLPPLEPSKRLGVGYSGACMIDRDGNVACWGQNPAGETGRPPNFTSSLELVEGVPPATQVVMSNVHTCALTISGEVYCWGSNLRNQLGHPAGTQGDVTCAPGAPHATLPCSWTPVRVNGLPKVLSISTALALDGVCALVDGGVAYCWGETLLDAPGTVACGTSQTVPERCFEGPVQLPGVSGLTDLAIGAQHACGNTSAGLQCWGRNSWYEISPEPCPATGCTAPVLRADLGTLAGPPGMGVNATCIRRQNGDVACFGRNDYAQLAHRPGTGGDTNCFGACNPDATPIPELAGSLAISPTSEWSWCGIARDGIVYCWGSNGTSELGHPRGSQGDFTCGVGLECNATPSAVPDVTGAIAVTAGHWMACALDGDLGLWCWGGDNEIAPTRIGP